MPVVANLDGEDRVEPTVEQTFLRFQAAKAREEAVRRADDGDFDAAAAGLRDAAVRSRASARRTRHRRGDRGPPRGGGAAGRSAGTRPGDRKYQGARAMAARELKADYAARVSRRRPAR